MKPFVIASLLLSGSIAFAADPQLARVSVMTKPISPRRPTV